MALTLPQGVVGVVYTPVTISAHSPAELPRVYSDVPSGLSVTQGSTNDILVGIPETIGTFHFFGFFPSTGTTAEYIITITYKSGCGLITVLPNVLLPAVNEESYSTQFSASSGTAPYTYSIVDGVLPIGMTLSATGLLSGIPTVSGNYIFTVRAVDSSANSCPGVIAFSDDNIFQVFPNVNAGDDANCLLSNGYDLLGNVSTGATVLWSKIDGPGNVTFTDNMSPTTHVDFDANGIYLLKLAATENGITYYSYVILTVLNLEALPIGNPTL